jgi:hypothetical protein
MTFKHDDRPSIRQEPETRRLDFQEAPDDRGRNRKGLHGSAQTLTAEREGPSDEVHGSSVRTLRKRFVRRP